MATLNLLSLSPVLPICRADGVAVGFARISPARVANLCNKAPIARMAIVRIMNFPNMPTPALAPDQPSLATPAQPCHPGPCLAKPVLSGKQTRRCATIL